MTDKPLFDWQVDATQEMLMRRDGEFTLARGSGKTSSVIYRHEGRTLSMRTDNLQLHAFLITFPSMWIGGTAVILAYNEQDAKGLLLRTLEAACMPQVSVDLMDVKPLPLGRGTIYFHNGDY